MKIKKKKLGGGESGWGVRVDVNEELKFWGNFKKTFFFWGGGGGGGAGVGSGGGGGWGGQGGCERRIKVFVKIKKKWGGGRGGCEGNVGGRG